MKELFFEKSSKLFNLLNENTLSIQGAQTLWLHVLSTRKSWVTQKHLRPVTSLRKRLWCKWFPANSAKFLRTPSLKKNLGFCKMSIP